MKANWINEFRSEIDELAVRQQSVVSMRLHYKVGDSWNLANDSQLSTVMLQKALDDDAYRKVGKQKRYLFPVVDANLVVDADFALFPKRARLDGLRAAISKAKDDSQHRFDAHHDSLTSCKNRKSFDKAVSAALSSMASQASPLGPSLGSSGGLSLTLVSLDIDHFKRINDTRGHDYGDVVLRSFAWHLEDECERIATEQPKAKFSLFRLGGEEFNVLISGDIDERAVLRFVESLRHSVQIAHIPSESQLSTIRREFGAAIPAPSEAERRITASFGVARIVGPIPDSEVLAVIEKLKNQADKALYSAKNSGRNQVRYFPDILKRYGHVLENDAASGVVAIDIGSEVGVVPGREFFVVPERYTGEVHYIVDDGRSSRSLGKIPRIKVARIVAFDVQPEISFCAITERREGTVVSRGCFLEAIPLGLFGGLSTPYGSATGLGDVEGRKELGVRFESLPKDQARMIALRIEGVRDVEKRFGQVKANELLAASDATLVRVLPGPLKAFQTEVGQFGAVFAAGDGDIDQLMNELTAGLRGVCGGIVDFTLGIFDHRSVEAASATSLRLDQEFAFDYAVIAAAAARGNEVEIFSVDSPRRVMNERDEARAFEQVVADHKKFRDIGIIDSVLDNLAGIAYFRSGNLEQAAAAFRVSFDAEENSVVRKNYAVSQFLLHNYVDAYVNIAKSMELEEDSRPSDDVRALFAIAALESHLATGVPDAENVETLFEAVDQAAGDAWVETDRLSREISRWRDFHAAG